MMGAWISTITTIRSSALRTTGQTRRWRLVVVTACLGVLIFQVYQLIRPQNFYGSQLCLSDFQWYYHAARDVLHGVDPYLRAIRIRGTSVPGLCNPTAYVYPPFFAALLIPFTAFSFPVAMALWDACNMLFLAGAIYMLLRAAGMRASLVLVSLLAAVVSLFSPIRSVLYWGQADLFILCCMGGALWAASARRYWLAGLLLAMACAVKPTYLGLIVFLLWKREFKLAVVSTVAFLALFFAPFLWLGGRALHDEIVTLQYLSTGYITTETNNAPKGVLARLFTVNPPLRPLVVAPALVTLVWLAVVVAVLLLTVALISPRRLQWDTRSLLEIGLALLALSLISPMTEDNHMSLLVVPLLSLYVWLTRADWRDRRVRLVALAAGGVILLLAGPVRLHSIEVAFWAREGSASWPLGEVYMLLAAVYLYLMIALFALQLRVISLTGDRPIRVAVRQVIGGAPTLAARWLQDARTAWASLDLMGS